MKITPKLKPFKSCMLMLALVLASCESFVSVPAPSSQLSSGSVYQDDATASSAMYGVYIQMMSSSSNFASGGSGSVAVLAGLSADELENQSAASGKAGFYTNALDKYNSDNLRLWQQAYKTIYYTNAVIEGLENATGVSMATKSQLRGEARFLRAFCHFYLVNLYGDVPLVLSTNYQVNKNASRTASDQVYSQIITDLEQARTLLSSDYDLENGERIRPNALAATALLARVYLYRKDWSKAAALASEVISNQQYGLVGVDSIFLKNSREAIWQLMPVSPVLNTYEGNTFILISKPNNVSLSGMLVSDFSRGDLRKAWIANFKTEQGLYYYPFKYKIRFGTPVEEYSIVLRLAEQYLIRAEAFAQQQLTDQAIADVDKIRVRAGLSALSEIKPRITGQALLDSIEKERRFELFSEWGHRWFDLKRSGSVGKVLEGSKGVNWKGSSALYPIPDSEIQLNPKLVQNPGYN